MILICNHVILMLDHMIPMLNHVISIMFSCDNYAKSRGKIDNTNKNYFISEDTKSTTI